MMLASLRPIRFFLFFVVTGFSFQLFADEQQYDAGELVSLAQKSLTRVIESAQQDEALQLDDSRSKPFWEAVKQMSDSLETASGNLEQQDNNLFVELATAVAASQQAGIAVLMIPGVSDQVKGSLSRTSQIVSTLDENFSKEASRLTGDKKLTAEEKAQLEKLKSEQKALREKLDEMEKTIAKNNEEIKKGIDDIREKSDRILKARNTHADFCHALFMARFMSGAIWGWHFWWGPWGYWGPGFVNIHITVWDTWTDYYVYDWALLDETVAEAEIIEDAEDLEYYSDLGDVDVAGAQSLLENVEYEVDTEDLMELSNEYEGPGWDEVDTEAGQEVLEGYESNFEHSPFDQGHDIQVFDDFGGYDDFGGSFDFY